MSELIDRQAAIDAINSWRGRFSEEYNEAIDDCENSIKELPTVQPEPQEGHWINGKCDLCGEHAPFWCMASTYHESNYCPRCGARMKGVSNERTD